MEKVVRLRTRLVALAAALFILFGGWLAWHLWHRPVSGIAPVATPSGAAPAILKDDPAPTLLYAHNLLLRKGPDFRIYVRWIRGQMLRTHADANPSFDDSDSFVLYIEKGVIHANIGDICNYLNAVMPKDAPLKNISIQPQGNQLKLHGTFHKGVPLPVELVGDISAVPDGRVRFQVSKINVLKIPMKKILGGFHIRAF